MEKNHHIRWILLSTLFITQIIIYIVLWTQMITNHNLRTGMDFIAFYTAGRIAQTDGIRHVYDVDRQRVIQESEVGHQLPAEQVLLYNHLPFFFSLDEGGQN